MHTSCPRARWAFMAGIRNHRSVSAARDRCMIRMAWVSCPLKDSGPRSERGVSRGRRTNGVSGSSGPRAARWAPARSAGCSEPDEPPHQDSVIGMNTGEIQARARARAVLRPAVPRKVGFAGLEHPLLAPQRATLEVVDL